MLELTKQERYTVMFLLAAAVLGIGIICYKSLRYVPRVSVVSDNRIEDQIAQSRVININTASKGQIVSLKGIGPALADAIIEYRAVHGGFRDKEELMDVKGIGRSKYDEIKDNIKIE